jgi:hypothetical protein
MIKADAVVEIADQIRRYRELVKEAEELAEILEAAKVDLGRSPTAAPTAPPPDDDGWSPTIHWYDKTVPWHAGRVRIRAYPPNPGDRNPDRRRRNWTGSAVYNVGCETVLRVGGGRDSLEAATRDGVAALALLALSEELAQRGGRPPAERMCRARNGTCLNRARESGFCGVHEHAAKRRMEKVTP